MSGWGTKREEDMYFQENLQKAAVKIIPNIDCQQMIGHDLIVEESMLCIASPDSEESVDSCTGDQGGPLIMDDNGHSVLIGLISFGIGTLKPSFNNHFTFI